MTSTKKGLAIAVLGCRKEEAAHWGRLLHRAGATSRCYDTEPHRAYAWARQWGGSAHEQIETLLAARLDACIATMRPRLRHTPLAEILRAGVPALVQPPLSTSLDKARELHRIAMESGAWIAAEQLGVHWSNR